MYNTKQKLIFSTLAAFFTATTLCAGEVTIPNTFSANTKAKASEVNANFTAVKTAVDGNVADIATNKADIPLFITKKGPLSRVLTNDYVDISFIVANPLPGDYVHVIATGMIAITNKVNDIEAHVFVGITDDVGTAPESFNHTRYAIGAGTDAGTHMVPYTVQAVFLIDDNGLKSYNVVAKGYGAETETLWENRLTVTIHKSGVSQ